MKNKLVKFILMLLIVIVFSISLILTINNLTQQKSQINQTVNISLLSNTQKINLNTATKDQLVNLPGIGEVLAQRIIDYRQKKKISSIEELDQIKGFGNERINALRNEVFVN